MGPQQAFEQWRLRVWMAAVSTESFPVCDAPRQTASARGRIHLLQVVVNAVLTGQPGALACVASQHSSFQPQHRSNIDAEIRQDAAPFAVHPLDWIGEIKMGYGRKRRRSAVDSRTIQGDR